MGVLLRIHARTADYHVFQLENIKQPVDLRYRHQIDDVVDEIVARQVFDCLGNAAVFEVGGGAEQSELERPCLALIEAGADRRHEVDPYVSLAFGEVDQVPLGHQFDHDIWVDRIEIGKLLREVKGSDAFHCGEPDAVGGFARDGAPMVSTTERPSVSIFSAIGGSRWPSSVSRNPSGLRSNSLTARSFWSSVIR